MRSTEVDRERGNNDLALEGDGEGVRTRTIGTTVFPSLTSASSASISSSISPGTCSYPGTRPHPDSVTAVSSGFPPSLTGLRKNEPTSMGREVPIASSNRNEEMSPGKSECERDEKRKAERPKPAIVMPVAVAR